MDVKLPAIIEFQRPDKDETKQKIVSYEDALTQIGFGRVQLTTLFAIGFVLMDMITESMGIGNLIPAAKCDLNLTGTTMGLLTSMPFFGIVASSYVFGYLGDTHGRRFVIMWTLFLAKVFTIIAAFVQNLTLFMACRFMTGVFLGGYSGVMYAYLGEFCTSKHRPAILSWVGVFIGVAYTVMPLTARWLNSYEWRFGLYEGYEFRPWRLALIMYSIPGIIGWLFLLRLPESPKYLLTVRKDEEAYKIVQWIHKTNNSKNTFDITGLKLDEQGVGNSLKGWKGVLASLRDQTMPLLKPPHVIYFLACCVLQYGTFFISAGLGLFLPDILNKLSKYRDETCDVGGDCSYHVCDIAGYEFKENIRNVTEVDEVCDDLVDSEIFQTMILLGIVYTCIYILASAVMKAERRIYIIALTFISSSIFGFILPFISNHTFITITFIITIASAGLNITLINGAACDIFPTYLRSMAVSFSLLVGRFGSTTATNIFGSLLNDYCHSVYIASATMGFICFLLSFVITKGRQS